MKDKKKTKNRKTKGRGKKRNSTTKVQPNVSLQAAGYLNQLVKLGTYGNTPTEVALKLINDGLNDLLRTKILVIKRKK